MVLQGRGSPPTLTDGTIIAEAKVCDLRVLPEKRQQWSELTDLDKNAFSKFLNLHCLKTNEIEGTVQFDSTTATRLVQVGFFEQVDIREIASSTGTIRHREEAMLVLQDTHKAIEMIFQLVRQQPVVLSLDFICRLHKVMMTSSPITVEANSCVNVSVAISASTGGTTRIQFFPFDTVNTELETFCQKFNELIRVENMDPFSAAAWISHDGNGQLSRMLASIPLLLKQLPALCIGPSHKSNYNTCLNAVSALSHRPRIWNLQHSHTRSTRNGDYDLLMQAMYQGTLPSMLDIRTVLTQS
ncbi:hypothetical protein D9758_011844 [Tetrapyrgos nigripes]|uniref:Uncharacterized protein n=1 Tax=Tetrapyrgos nigripes TaxID=182062 RepID=A0A8H5CKI0_9AGAR|nr:hypothetical protein D9758_011844 [Tetrapyrgos nigripes]